MECVNGTSLQKSVGGPCADILAVLVFVLALGFSDASAAVPHAAKLIVYLKTPCTRHYCCFGLFPFSHLQLGAVEPMHTL